MASDGNGEVSHIPNLREYEQSEPEEPQDHDSLLLQDESYSRPASENFDTLSLRDSLFDFVLENGRTYLRDHSGSYMLPNDNDECERLNLQHIIISALMRGKLYLAPLQTDARNAPRRILDMGCGTGIWCTEMAKDFRRTEITGTDISPIQGEAPENVRWEVANCLKDSWGGPFDYIHTRIMLGTAPDFKEVIKRAYYNLEPGGWMESQELWPKAGCDDGTMPDNYLLAEWTSLQDRAAMDGDPPGPLRIADKLRRWYKEVGFVDVEQEIFKIPINGWPREPRLNLLGKWWGQHLCEGLNGFSMRYFTQVLGWSPMEVEAYIAKVRQSIKDRDIHAYHRIFVVWGRKPTVEEDAARRAAQPGSSVPVASSSKPVASSSL